jgi:hypothetical protein
MRGSRQTGYQGASARAPMPVQGHFPPTNRVRPRALNNLVDAVTGLRAAHLVPDTGDTEAGDRVRLGGGDDNAAVGGFIT